jgi:FAD/FMN-containing dehydrogenase
VIAIIKEETARRPTTNIMFDLWAMGAGVSRIPADATAMGDRSAPFTAVFNTTWVNPADGEASIEWTRNLYNRLQPHSSGGSYLNFPGFMEEEKLVEKAFGRNYGRLAQIKAKYDPNNLFSLNQNVKPTTS